MLGLIIMFVIFGFGGQLDVSVNTFKDLVSTSCFTGIFQSSGIFNVQIDVTDVEALEYYADWLLFLGKGVEFERIPDELRVILEERLANLRFS